MPADLVIIFQAEVCDLLIKLRRELIGDAGYRQKRINQNYSGRNMRQKELPVVVVIAKRLNTQCFIPKLLTFKYD